MSDRVAYLFCSPRPIETDEAVLGRLYRAAGRIAGRRALPRVFFYRVSRGEFYRLTDDIHSRARRLGDPVVTAIADDRPAIPVAGLFVVV